MGVSRVGKWIWFRRLLARGTVLGSVYVNVYVDAHVFVCETSESDDDAR